MSVAFSIRKDIDSAPKEPGCYLFKDLQHKVLYIGKAKVLRNRVRSYLRPDADGRIQIPVMLKKAHSVEYVITSNEKEALVLENNLIKIHRPRYNVMLKDDRTFVSLRLDLRQTYPRAKIVHKYKKDGATYVGPFASSTKLRQTLEALKRIFPLRRCSDHVLNNRTRVCVYHDVGTCSGPCVEGNVTPEKYREYVQGLMDVLKGRDTGILKHLEQEMQDAATHQNYERAATLRDQVFAIRSTIERQNAQIDGSKSINRDVIGLYRKGEYAQLHVLLYREDKLVGSSTHQLSSALPDDELVEQFTARYYEGDRPIPPEVLLPVQVDDPVSLGQYIADKAGFAVNVSSPQRGDKLALIRLATLNAEHAMKDREAKDARTEATLLSLQNQLELENIPRTMECYDISHFQGDQVVGSGVCFVDGVPEKKRYRRYKVKTVEGNDDFASMEEVLRRRLKRASEEGNFPDLIVIDGGTQQLARVQKVFEEVNVVGVDLIGLAKSRDKTGSSALQNYASNLPKHITKERVFLPGKSQPVTLDQKSQEIFMLMRLRDEAHRFAITYHRELKRKVALSSGIDSIPGVGPKRKRALIKHFGSPAQIKQASLEEIAAVDGITEKLATTIFEHFKAQQDTSHNSA